MGCEICGKNGCSRSFHSLDVQEEFDRFDDMSKNDLINLVIELEEEIRTSTEPKRQISLSSSPVGLSEIFGYDL